MKSLGIVVGGVDFGEADRVVHVLTDRGRRSLFAHGARQSRKRFAGALDPFSTIVMEIDDRRRTGLLTLSSAIVSRPRLALRSDLSKLALAAYVVELGAAVAPEEDPADALYAFVESILDHLVEMPATRSLQRVFEVRLMTLLGFSPVLAACAACGGEQTTHVDFGRGGVLCAEHGQGARRIGPRTIAWLEHVLDVDDICTGDEIDSDWADRASIALTDPLARFFSGLVGQPLKSLAMLADVGFGS